MTNILKKILDSIEFYVLAGVLFIVIWYFVLSPRKIDGVSMFPYLHNNDYVLMYKLEYLGSTPKRGDVVVFKHSMTQDYIKRIIALPGETVLIRNGKVYVNDKLLDESLYLASTVVTNPAESIREGLPYVVPQGRYVLMGDNRERSTDSRSFGAVEKEAIEGRAVLLWFPPQNMKLIQRVTYQ